MPPLSHPTARSGLAIGLLLVLVVLAGLLLRALGIGYTLPETRGHDERVVAMQVEHFRHGTPPPPNESWVLASYPHLAARLCALLPEPGSALAPEAGLERHLVNASASWRQLRLSFVLLSLLSVPLTWILARRWLTQTGALLAAGLVATSLFHITLSIQQKPHAAAASFDLLALLAALELARKPGLRSALFAGLAAALAVGTLHSAVLVLPPLAVALVHGSRRVPAGQVRRVLAASVPVAASVALCYPFFLPGVEAAGDEAPRGAGLAGFATFLGRNLGGARFLELVRGVWELDPLLFVLGLAGTALALREVWSRGRVRNWFRAEHAVLLAFVLPYALVLALYHDTLVRFLLPFLPLAAVLAAFACERLVLPFAGPAWPARAGLAAALLLLPAWPAAHFAWMRGQPSPLDECARWIEQNLDPAETIVFLPYGDLPLVYDPACVAENVRSPHRSAWSEYQQAHPVVDPAHAPRRVLVEPGKRPGARADLQRDPLAYLRASGARYVVIDLSGGGQALLAGVATRVARFSPRIEDREKECGLSLAGTGWDRMRPGAWRVLGMRSMGTTLEVYRLP